MSRPMRARGLKLLLDESKTICPGVAPHAGAWIETYDLIKHKTSDQVAPHAGAWIETWLAIDPGRTSSVAPHAGAWIETAGCDEYRSQ